MSDQESMVDVDKEMNPILKKGNYKYWRTMTEASLVFLGCWDAVQPGFTSAERMKAECIKMDNKARAYIFRHVRREYLGDIRTLKTARECWKTLEHIHGRSTSMDIVLCMRELGTIEKTPSMDVSEYCGRIQDLCDKLFSVGIKIEDHVMACFLLAGLVVDPDYETYLRTTRTDKDLSAKVVKSDLLLEERRLDAAEGSSERGSAMATRRRGKSKQHKDGARPKTRDAHDQKCYKRGKMGHISYQCQDQKGDKEERNQMEKKRQEDNRRDRGLEEKPRSKGLISTLTLSSISHMSRERISYLDSGASNHMTPDRHRFVEFTPAKGQIRIGKGYLEVKGRGTIVVKMAESCGGWTLSLSNALWVPELDVNLISIRQLAKKGVTTVCTRDCTLGHTTTETPYSTQRLETTYTILRRYLLRST